MVSESFPLIYVLICILVAICLYKDTNKLLLLGTSIFMTVVVLLRGIGVGTDYEQYVLNFKYNIVSLDFEFGDNFGLDSGSANLIFYFKQISSNYFIFYGLVYIVYYFGLSRYAKSKNISYGWFLFLFFFLGYYFMSFNIIRQLMTIAIVLLFMPLLENKRYTMYALVIIIVSFFFHKSEIEMLLLIPIHYFSNKSNKINKPLLIFLLMSSFTLFYIGRTFIYDYLSSLMSLIQVNNQYGVYIDRIDARDGFGNMTSLLFTSFACFLVICKCPTTHIFETNAVVFSYVLFNIGNILASQATRVYLDFNIIILVLIPLMISEKGTLFQRSFKIVTIMLCLIYFGYSYVINNRDGIKPYYFLFESNEKIR